MKIIDLFKENKQTLSFEFFPPKTEEQENNLFQVLGELKSFNPDFASVTYGALGSTREKSFIWAKKIKHDFKIEPVAHLTCVAATRKSIKEQVEELRGMGVENILALRGDPPEGNAPFVPPKDGFHYAKELISYIRSLKHEICLGAAGFPEGNYPIEHLKQKVEAGAEFIITQLFFDNNYYFDFVERCKNAGINVPIIPGIMPIINIKQIKKMTEISGAKMPSKLLSRLEEHSGDKEDIEEIGIEQAVFQCKELIERGAPGLHFFVMNQSGPISKILSQL